MRANQTSRGRSYSTLHTRLLFNYPDGGFPCDDLRKILPGCQQMAKVPYGVHRKIAENFNRLSRAHERYRRQTDRQTTDGRTMTYSERELEFTFAN